MRRDHPGLVVACRSGQIAFISGDIAERVLGDHPLPVTRHVLQCRLGCAAGLRQRSCRLVEARQFDPRREIGRIEIGGAGVERNGLRHRTRRGERGGFAKPRCRLAGFGFTQRDQCCNRLVRRARQFERGGLADCAVGRNRHRRNLSGIGGQRSRARACGRIGQGNGGKFASLGGLLRTERLSPEQGDDRVELIGRAVERRRLEEFVDPDETGNPGCRADNQISPVEGDRKPIQHADDGPGPGWGRILEGCRGPAHRNRDRQRHNPSGNVAKSRHQVPPICQPATVSGRRNANHVSSSNKKHPEFPPGAFVRQQS